MAHIRRVIFDQPYNPKTDTISSAMTDVGVSLTCHFSHPSPRTLDVSASLLELTSVDGDYSLLVQTKDFPLAHGKYIFTVIAHDGTQLACAEAPIQDLLNRIDALVPSEYLGYGSTRKAFFRAAIDQIVSGDNDFYDKLFAVLVEHATACFVTYVTADFTRGEKPLVKIVPWPVALN